ncbi:U3 small nucleolar RNA-associated protein 6 homolog [Aplysia californica]|uniref:U3 small nucleolar RNA-associated protein 6 homolog n=1 Tax=Aplysia californica TaxID=6500 RepID=A0ABM0JTC7_APLCA|nr:U3 small nucleolar RNA-associated protein 6 homolog [Aplysia californica]
MRPISMSFYRLYVQAECAQETPNLKLIRGAFEEALVEFGLNEPDLWLNYVQMEREVAKDGARAGAIQQRALNGLDPHLKETFIRKQVMAGLSA